MASGELEKYFHNDIACRAQELYLEHPEIDPEINWARAEREIINRGFRPKAIVVVEVLPADAPTLTTSSPIPTELVLVENL